MKIDYDKVAAIEIMIQECLSAKEEGHDYFMCWTIWGKRVNYNNLADLKIYRYDAPATLDSSAYYSGDNYENRLAHLHFALFRLLNIVK